MDRARELLGAPASAGLVLLMLAGCLFLWIGVPLTWLWIGSQIQSSASLGTALMVTMLGITVSIILVVIALAWLNRRHLALQERRHPGSGGSASVLELILVSSCAIALVLFGIWFFGFAGTSPLPLNIGY